MLIRSPVFWLVKSMLEIMESASSGLKSGGALWLISATVQKPISVMGIDQCKWQLNPRKCESTINAEQYIEVLQ